ncbi:hypothetical protein BV22DRAFT_1041043 [Leucogyrophana mollusca]|uniref:Uncharacterized protein n=1 Tax=Leucogyrophana mollusca TaxID=85980 RepID=A0ACB8B0W3_9AGAM|nr:hypothetical protein BV22DRAFT_1041043 [Leucogyrophana mollusca]
MDQDVASPERRVRFASQQGVVIIEPTEEEEETIESSEDEQPFRTGPGGVKFSLSGRQLFGQEGTVQVDPTYRHDRRAARLLARKPTEPLDDDANKENDEHLGSVEVNGSSFDVILRPRRSARLALPRPSQMQQPAWGPIAAVTGPVRSPKKTFRRRLGPYGTVLIDPVTFRELTPC